MNPEPASSQSEPIPEIKKKKMGRPPKTTDDLPANWEEIVIFGSLQGKFEEQIKRDILISGGENLKSMNNLWAKLKERDNDFREAIKKGEILRKAWWLDVMQNNLTHTKDFVFETASWFIVMKNCFGWKDKTEIEHGIADETFEKYKELKPEQISGRLQALIGYDASRAPGRSQAVITAS